MRSFQKPLFTVLIAIAVFIGGFFFLLRGCLSKYDERSALSPVLYFEGEAGGVLFSIVKFEEATSYSQKGGFTNKTVSTSYYIQINDAASGKKIENQKIKHQRDLKSQPAGIMGSTAHTAWVFIGEAMAFDPFTLEKKADRKILEDKNPFIANKLPLERKYYIFNPDDSTIRFTATDGAPYKINTTTLVITPSEELEKTGSVSDLEQLKKLEMQNEARQDSLYQQKSVIPSRRLMAKEITYKEYRRITNIFMQERKELYSERDSLQELIGLTAKKVQAATETRKKVETLNSKPSVYFNQAKSNMDTLNDHWYGIYTKQEIEKMYDRFQYTAMYGETARRQLFAGNANLEKSGDLVIDKNSVIPGSVYFLDGGFLLNKQTGLPTRLPGGNSFLVIHKDQIGSDGKVQLSRVNTDGKKLWTFDTQLKEWADWIYTAQRIFVFGTNNKNLSGGEINILWSIDLESGKAVMYDYFKD